MIGGVRLPREEGWGVHARAFGNTRTLDVEFHEEDDMSQIDLFEDETGIYVLLSFVDANNDAVAFRLTY